MVVFIISHFRSFGVVDEMFSLTTLISIPYSIFGQKSKTCTDIKAKLLTMQIILIPSSIILIYFISWKL